MEQLIKDFTLYKKDVEGRANNSINLYVKNFKEFCKDMEINTYEKLIDIKAQDIKDWLSILADKGNGATTRNNKLSAIKQFFLFLEEEKEENIDRKISKIKYAKTPHKESRYIDEKLAWELVESTSNQRLKAAIITLIKTGMRFSELTQITCTDIDRGFAVIVGKGNKERKIWFEPNTLKFCNEFINGKRRHILNRTKANTDILFISDDGNPMSRQSFSLSLKRLAEKIGLYWSDEVSPHKIRHGCVTEALNEGVPISVVRDMVGHASMQTTNRYAHTQEEQVKMAMLRNCEDYRKE